MKAVKFLRKMGWFVDFNLSTRSHNSRKLESTSALLWQPSILGKCNVCKTAATV